MCTDVSHPVRRGVFWATSRLGSPQSILLAWALSTWDFPGETQGSIDLKVKFSVKQFGESVHGSGGDVLALIHDHHP